MSADLVPNEGKQLDATVDGVRYLRLPIKTRLIKPHDDLMQLLEEYMRPYLQKGDTLFVSEKIVCICQGQMIRRDEVKTSWLAHYLASKVRNYEGTPEFRGLGHGTAPAMQLVIDEAGYLRVIFAAVVSALTRHWLPGAFYLLIGKQAKSVDCPMSWTIKPFDEYAKRAPLHPRKVAEAIKARFGVEVVIVDANYRGAFSLATTTRAMSDTFIQKLLHDNPAGQDSEMTPFFLVRTATH